MHFVEYSDIVFSFHEIVEHNHYTYTVDKPASLLVDKVQLILNTTTKISSLLPFSVDVFYFCHTSPPFVSVGSGWQQTIMALTTAALKFEFLSTSCRSQVLGFMYL